MSATAVPLAASPVVRPVPTVLTLARADARRFARHPLFLFGVAVLVALVVASLVQGFAGDPAPLWPTLLVALFLGVFGFVVAHRLTTSLRRSGELANTSPVGLRQRTAALCLACLVPAAAATLFIIYLLVAARIAPPVGTPVGAPVAWFGDEPDLAILAALVASGPVAALGGPLLGVAVALWAPFRGSALLGVVVLVVGTSLPSSSPSPWRALVPWAVLADEFVVDGKVASSSLVDGVSPQWYLGFVLCLCGLAVVAALLRDPDNRRPFVWAGIAFALGAIGFFTLTVS